jgi:hypothetical protein
LPEKKPEQKTAVPLGMEDACEIDWRPGALPAAVPASRLHRKDVFKDVLTLRVTSL